MGLASSTVRASTKQCENNRRFEAMSTSPLGRCHAMPFEPLTSFSNSSKRRGRHLQTIAIDVNF